MTIFVGATSGLRCLSKLFFTGEEYNKMKFFLEKMSDQTIEITQYSIACYYVYYCKHNEIKVEESKIENYVERMQQTLLQKDLKRIRRNYYILSQTGVVYSTKIILSDLVTKL